MTAKTFFPGASDIRIMACLLLFGVGFIIILSGLIIEDAVQASSENAGGRSTDNMAGVFSIQKSIILGGNNPASELNGQEDPFSSDPPIQSRIGPRLLLFDFQPRYLNSSVHQPVNFTMILDDLPKDHCSLFLNMDLAQSANSSKNISSATFVSPSHGQAAAVVFTPVNATSVSGDLSTIYQGCLLLPQSSEPGQWTLEGLRIYDRRGHRMLLDADEVASYGFPTEISVG